MDAGEQSDASMDASMRAAIDAAAGPRDGGGDGSDPGPDGDDDAGASDASSASDASDLPDAQRDAGDAGDEAPNFARVYAEVISVRCAFCHHPDLDGEGDDVALIGYSLGHLDMHDIDSAYANLVGDGGVAAAGIHCGPPESPAGLYKRVIPGDYANSLIYTKVTNPVCGVRMPDGYPQLSEPEIALIREWIRGGAK
jgi:hypothetical protein